MSRPAWWVPSILFVDKREHCIVGFQNTQGTNYVLKETVDLPDVLSNMPNVVDVSTSRIPVSTSPVGKAWNDQWEAKGLREEFLRTNSYRAQGCPQGYRTDVTTGRCLVDQALLAPRSSKLLLLTPPPLVPVANPALEPAVVVAPAPFVYQQPPQKPAPEEQSIVVPVAPDAPVFDLSAPNAPEAPNAPDAPSFDNVPEAPPAPPIAPLSFNESKSKLNSRPRPPPPNAPRVSRPSSFLDEIKNPKTKLKRPSEAKRPVVHKKNGDAPSRSSLLEEIKKSKQKQLKKASERKLPEKKQAQAAKPSLFQLIQQRRKDIKEDNDNNDSEDDDDDGFETKKKGGDQQQTKHSKAMFMVYTQRPTKQVNWVSPPDYSFIKRRGSTPTDQWYWITPSRSTAMFLIKTIQDMNRGKGMRLFIKKINK